MADQGVECLQGRIRTLTIQPMPNWAYITKWKTAAKFQPSCTFRHVKSMADEYIDCISSVGVSKVRNLVLSEEFARRFKQCHTTVFAILKLLQLCWHHAFVNIYLTGHMLVVQL
jgi:hypothetical protein